MKTVAGVLLLCLLGSSSCIPHKKTALFFESEKDVAEVEDREAFLGSNVGNGTKCQNPKYSCPDKNTCCPGMPPTGFACCPYPQGVCCQDKQHCCPPGSHCDMVKKGCYKPSTNELVDVFNAPLKRMVSERAVVCPGGQQECADGQTCCRSISSGYKCCMYSNVGPLESVVCAGGQSTCPDGKTCCKLASGTWGCCPLPQAVCCSDGSHCCPNGYTCDMSAGKCLKGNEIMEWFSKTEAQKIEKEEGVVCPDGQSSCPDGNTCCKTAGGTYACCPLPKAVCCSDHTHCCPDGFTCDIKAGRCEQGNYFMEWLSKTEAKKVNKAESVPCPDGKSACPDGNTCCKLSSGEYGCCPLPQAVCCSDGTHCCPNGYTCDVSAGRCQKGNDVMEWFSKIEAQKLEREENVPCPDGKSACPDGNTCCKLSSGQFGCCPLPQAVCCSDGTHCCPNGYTCDVSAGRCLKGNDVMEWFSKIKAQKVENVPCPDGKSACPDGNTCCKLSSGQFGCCPLPQAVCCSDGTHCCPNGYTCDVSAGRCQKGNDVMEWFSKIKAQKVENVPCPDGKSACPDGNTCCKLSSGEFGCCPLPQAVCCSDGTHCCPNGYTCDVSAGRCLKGNDVMEWFSKIKAQKVENVPCPDGKSACPDGNTCCKLSSGQFGCCPLPQAVCCSDGTHCCPNGYTCDVSAGRCQKGNDVMEWFSKIKAQKVENVPCPDGKSACPDGNTCCKLSSGQFGCCPLPQAVCCSDGTHCCPNGYTCDVSAGRCLKGNDVMEWFSKIKAQKVENVPCPDGKSACPDGNTCCKLSSGQYGCCPLPQAVCCSDGTHCCPNGYTCDVSAGRCLKGNDVMEWFSKIKAQKVENVPCPDGKSACPDGNTCCKLSSGQFGCCPLPQAVCCSDGTHCCPNGYTCDVSAGRCLKGNDVMEWFSKIKAEKVENVPCPDGKSACPDGNTCCKLSSGEFGCCPLPQAVCCSDGTHCCPNGYTCDVSAGRCLKGNDVMEWFSKIKAQKVENVPCPDGKSACPDGNTCCKLSSGEFGCCPLLQAVCCSDGTHCCPNGYTCDVSAGRCLKGNDVMEWFSKIKAQKVENVPCPDGKSACPDGNTCCKLSSGQFGCCPLPQAVCCSDGTHCCPNGYTCDVSAGRCLKGNDVMEWFSKIKAQKVENVPCPDGKSACPDGNTCCKLSSGEFGCCPLPQAVCCSDGTHCCPNGYTCDVSAGRCQKGNDVMEWFSKIKAQKVENVPCPDGKSACPDGNTCCKLSSGQFGCCPLPQAVCCSDGTHCCPNGYTCDVSAGRCQKGNDVMEWFSKIKAQKVENVPCPDGKSACPDGNTCCKLSSGQFGCCPLPQAVCCSDGTHCCPNGYTCDVSAGRCLKGNDVMEWFSKIEAQKVENVPCPDGKSACPDGNTCCKLSSGQYGCCPLPQAVCCSDGTHCCPNGYTCDVSAGRCLKGNDVLEWFSKIKAQKVENVPCPDGKSACPDGNTCCKLSSGQFGCCPLPQAVCCSDGTHCCPNGYTCDVSAGRCLKGNDVMEWFSKVKAQKVENVPCPDGKSACPDGNTCCKLSSGQFGCCPLPQAVCCSDGTHCCPNGYTCDVSAGRCLKGNDVMEWFSKIKAQKVENVPCPDGKSACPDGNTCCKLSSGEFGCCPLPQAVCCSDGTHCCPNGYTCDVSAGKCLKGNEVMEWFSKTEAQKVQNVENVPCPDGKSACPDGNTCCKLSSGQYGCCPLPQAVCCSDGTHCCPNGYTCDVSAGRCLKGNDVMEWFSKIEAQKVVEKVEGVVCPGGQSTCDEGKTCCQLASGSWACCPFPNALCCSDHIHCCPSGYKCDTSSGTCASKDHVMEWFTKIPAKTNNGYVPQVPVKMPEDTGVICPGGTASCPDGNTCCQLSSGQWGCCSYSQAVCCSDHVHCCPSGYKCDLQHGQCLNKDTKMPWLTKRAAKTIIPSSNTVTCPGCVLP